MRLVRADARVVGFGSGPHVEVLDVGTDGGDKDHHVLSPHDGQRGVPTSFASDQEGPDPVAEANVVGYPVSVVTSDQSLAYEEGSGAITADGGEPAPLYVVTSQSPHRGFARGCVFLMTETPMRPSTWHTATLAYELAGQRYEHVWRFETGPE